jgi:hypothetical protein
MTFKSTASFNLATHELKIWAGFLHELEQAGLPAETAIESLLNHEVGHYVTFPHDLATSLYLHTIAGQQFGKDGDTICAYYGEVVDDIDCFRSDIRREPHTALARAEARTGLSSIDRVTRAVHQEQLGIDLGITLTPDERKVLKDLTSIDYTAPWTIPEKHAVNLISFGEAIRGLIGKDVPKPAAPAKLDEIAKRMPGYEAMLAQSWPKVLATYLHPLVQQKPRIVLDLPVPLPGQGKGTPSPGCTGIDGYSDSQVNDALDDLIRRHGKIPYEMVRDHIGRTRPGFQDRFGQGKESKEKFAGTAGIDHIQWHDEEVPYYKRWASTYGLYIIKKPLKEDAFNLYPAQQKPFQTGDPLQKVNPWSCPYLLPGISQRWQEAKGKRVQVKQKVPDLFVMLDTSGSMTHPKYQSHAVLAAFVLGRNYHANGSRVGIGNFSADILLMPPTRDLDAYQRAACAYWGGGTVLNVDRIKAWFEHLSRTGGKNVPDITISTEEDYEELIKKLGGDKRQFEEKHLEVRIREKLPELYERIDNILISDGAIGNITDVVDYLNSIARATRNTIFLIKSPNEYKAWTELGLKNTTIHPVDNPEDLTGLAIGRSKAIKEGLYTPEDRHGK